MKREKDQRTFLERLTGSVKFDRWGSKSNSIREQQAGQDTDLYDDTDSDTLTEEDIPLEEVGPNGDMSRIGGDFLEEDGSEADLNVDVSDDGRNIVVHAMVAGVRPDDLDVDIARDRITIRGSRSEALTTTDGNSYYMQELYWGSFSRTISLPEEIEVESAEAIEKHGLLTIILPKVDREKKSKVKIKSA